MTTLAALNAQSEASRGHEKSIPWNIGVKRDCLWTPDQITHLYHLPVYQKFSKEQKLAYNQAFALMLNEQFLMLEENVLMAIVRRVFSQKAVKERASPEFQQAIEHFIREEAMHVQMFWDLLHASEPAYEGQKKLIYFKPSWLSERIVRFFMSFPDFFIFWVWIGLYFEERFIPFYRQIKKSQYEIDPLHSAVHHAHLVDEARHVQLDENFVTEFWDRAPLWKRKLNAWILKHFFKNVLVNSFSARGLWKVIVKKHPDMAVYTDEVLAELKTLPDRSSYQELLFGRTSIPRTSKLFDGRKECHALSSVLKFYVPQA